MQAPGVDNAFHLLKKKVKPLLTGILFFSGAALLTCARALLTFHFIINTFWNNKSAGRTNSKQI